MHKETLNKPISTEQLIATCREILNKYDDQRIIAVYLYGSVLGKRYRSDSDVDIAVLDSVDNRLDTEAQSALMDRLERAIGLPVDLRMMRDGTLSFQVHVMDSGKTVWKREDESIENYSQAIHDRFDNQHEQRTQSWKSVIGALAGKVEPDS